jgi:uncharacterized protein
MALILLVLFELQGWPTWSVHVAGITLLTGRLSHAFGLYWYESANPFRFMGQTASHTVTAALGVLLLWGVVAPS